MQRKINLFIGFYLIGIFILLPININAAWVEDIPATLSQPDGTKISVFRSGDEFHNWVHDSEGYAIVQDENSGFWCWASVENGDIVSTGQPIHLENVIRLGLNPRENISNERYLEKKRMFDIPENRQRNVRAPTLGVINSLTIFVRFLDDTQFPTHIDVFDEIFNAQGENVNSMYQYFWDSSYGQLEVFSPFYPAQTGDFVISYQDTHPRSYYQPYNPVTNPNGYHGGSNDYDRINREQTLIRNTIFAIQNQIPSTLVIDGDNDGYVDNINFIIRGDNTEWADLLWPHKWSLFYYDVYIYGKQVWEYNFNLENFTLRQGASVLVHESSHSMGLPDLYRYDNQAITPIGFWDLMSRSTDLPHSISAYMKFRYTQWVPDLPAITTSGYYTLNPVTTHQTNHAYRIDSPHNTNEYFVVEYRSNQTGLIDSTIHGSGLLVYRVNPSQYGNSNGPPDELYVFRLNGTLTENGQVNNAFLSLESGRIAINDFTNPFTFLSNGTRGGLNISNISLAGETISFYVDLNGTAPELYPPRLLTSSLNSNTVLLSWVAPLESSEILLGYKTYNNDIYLETTNNINFTDNDPPQGANVYYVTALYENGESMGVSSAIYVPPSEAEISYIGNPASTQISHNPPFDFNRNNSLAQTIYAADQIGQTGMITRIVYRFYGDSHVPNDIPVRIYMATTNTFFFANDNSWRPFNDFTLVYEGGLDADVYEWCHVEIILDTPFYYEGNNLVVMTHRQWTDDIYREQNKWQTTMMTTNRTLYYSSNTPMNNLYNAGTRTSQIPNTILVFEEEVSEKNDDIIPINTALLGNYPNPFNPQTTINFALSVASNLRIDIYNIKGQKVKTLIDDLYPAGSHSVIWNGTDDSGFSVSSGVYFYKMEAGEVQEIRRMVLMK